MIDPIWLIPAYFAFGALSYMVPTLLSRRRESLGQHMGWTLLHGLLWPLRLWVDVYTDS